jgi:hypothetical protein
MTRSAQPDCGCVVCEAKAERNHIGGRNHIAWFTMPFCKSHHDQFHAVLRNAGINLEYTSDPQERLLRAIQACVMAQWIFAKMLEEMRNRQEGHPEKMAAQGGIHDRNS